MLCLVEQVAHTGSADADKHFYKFTTADREERHTGFSGNGFRQEGFTGAGRSDEQDTAGNSGAECGKAFARFQEINHFMQFLFRFVYTGDIVKGNLRFIAGE